MDEHIQLLRGKSVEFTGDFVDHNLNSLEWWKDKHRGYAVIVMSLIALLTMMIIGK